MEKGTANSGLAEEGLDFLEEGRACKGGVLREGFEGRRKGWATVPGGWVCVAVC